LGSQSQSGRSGEKEITTPDGKRISFVQPLAQSLYSADLNFSDMTEDFRIVAMF